MFRPAHIPNLICVLRIILVVPIVWCLLDFRYNFALVLIVIAGLSDGLDGYLARTYHWTTRVGGILDPLADKLLFVSVFAALCWTGQVPIWLFAVVIARDIVIVTGATCYEFLIGPVKPQPSRVGKLNTVMSLFYLFFVMTWQVYEWPPQVSILVAGASVFVVSVVSGIDYVLTWGRMALKSRKSS